MSTSETGRTLEDVIAEERRAEFEREMQRQRAAEMREFEWDREMEN